MEFVNVVGATSKPAVVDLFCGAGGLSYGMKQAGIQIVAGIDVDPACRYPFEANVGAKFYKKDVVDFPSTFVGSLFPKSSIRVLVGCAPCQPFSTYSSRYSGHQGEWHLLSKFGDLIADLKPEIVTMENVPRLRKYSIFDAFKRVLERTGYCYSYDIVRCTDYGVPQTRRRLVLLASRLGNIQLLPPTHGKDEFPSVSETIQHLEEIEAGGASTSDRLHQSSGLSDRNLERIRISTPGGTWRDWDRELQASCHTKETGKSYSSVYGRMQWDKPAPTVTTQFHGYGNGRFGHPEQDRAISLREGALLQTFPEDYSFVPEGEPIQISTVARLIGNAVPVKLGEVIGKSIVAHLGACRDA